MPEEPNAYPWNSTLTGTMALPPELQVKIGRQPSANRTVDPVPVMHILESCPRKRGLGNLPKQLRQVYRYMLLS